MSRNVNAPLMVLTILVVLTSLLLPGCGKSSTKSDSANSKSEVTDPLVTAIPSAPAPQAEIDDSTNFDEPNTPVTNELPETKQTNAEQTNADEQTAPPAVPPSVPTPTAEQLAKWKQPDFEPLQLLARNHIEKLAFVSCSAVSPDGKLFVLGGDKLTLWKMGVSGVSDPVATLWDFANTSDSDSIKSVAIAPNGNWVAAGDSTGLVRVWQLADQKEIVSKKIYNNDVVQLAISDDGQEIATATYGNEVSVWAATNLEAKSKFETQSSGITRLCYLGTDKLLIAGQSVTVWSTVTGKLLETIFETGYLQSVARSKDFVWLSVASEDAIQLRNLKDAALNRRLEGNFARNELQEFSSDGNRLWTANGSTIRAWELERGTILQVIDTFGPAIEGIHWLADESLLRVITEDGTIKLWGTVGAGASLGLKPLHAPVTLPEPTQSAPATYTQLLANVDLRSLPRPPQSKMTVGESSMVQFESTTSVDEVKSYYRYLLKTKGWVEQAGNPHTPDYLNFDKSGFRLFVNISSSNPPNTSVQLACLGNVSARSIPKFDAAPIKVIYEDESSALYVTKSDLLTIETALLKQLHAAGWIPYSRLNSSHSDDSERRDLEFIRNAITLNISVSRSIDDPTAFNIQHSTFLAPAHLPVPKDCDYIECDVARDPALVAFTSLNLNQCQSFYNQAMSSDGWLAAGTKQNSKDDVRWLTYYRGQQEVTIRFSASENGRTQILVGEHAEQNSWQLAKVESTNGADADSTPQKPGLQAADIPIYKQSDAKSVNHNAQLKQIEVTIPKTSHIEIVDYYAKQFGNIGWKEEPNGFRAEDYAFVTFTKEGKSIQIRVNSQASLNQTTYSISDDGILWTKSLPKRKELLSYESWLRTNHHPATLRLLEQFTTEMRQ